MERLRALFGGLVGADAEGVALVPATSYGFAVAARNVALRAGERVVVLADEYPSGIYTWRAATRAVGARIVTVRREAGQTWTEAILEVLDERVGVVSVPNVHWTDGALIDLAAVSARAHEIGARLVIDGSQSIGVMPFDVAALRPDFVVTVGYKWLLGPFGVGYLYVGEQHREGEPIEQNWIVRDGSQDFARLVDYRDEYQPGARRFDVGQRTKFELLPMAIAALEQLHAWQVPRIAADALGADREDRRAGGRPGIGSASRGAAGTAHAGGVAARIGAHRHRGGAGRGELLRLGPWGVRQRCSGRSPQVVPRGVSSMSFLISHWANARAAGDSCGVVSLRSR
ncbi:MAG: hypothetical protein QOG76_4176 [Pseudonocardiales bacterium]|nr:hypothetical protein [Pseudonocardiales bacterium]